MRNPKNFRNNRIKKIPLLLMIAVFFLPTVTHRSGVFAAETIAHRSGVYGKDCGDAFVVGEIGEPRTLIPILASDGPSCRAVRRRQWVS